MVGIVLLSFEAYGGVLVGDGLAARGVAIFAVWSGGAVGDVMRVPVGTVVSHPVGE